MRSHTARCRSLSRPSLAHLSRVTVRGSVETAARGEFIFCRCSVGLRPVAGLQHLAHLSRRSLHRSARPTSRLFFLLLPCGLPEASARPATPRPLQLRRVFRVLFVFRFALWASGRQPLDGLCEDFVGPPLSQPLRPPRRPGRRLRPGRKVANV